MLTSDLNIYNEGNTRLQLELALWPPTVFTARGHGDRVWRMFLSHTDSVYLDRE